jgi:hypothetical protein
MLVHAVNKGGDGRENGTRDGAAPEGDQGQTGRTPPRIVTVALNTGLREAKILEIDRTWLRKRDDGWWLILPAARSRLKQTPREIPLNPAAYEALRSDLVHVDGRISSGDGMRLPSARSGDD